MNRHQAWFSRVGVSLDADDLSDIGAIASAAGGEAPLIDTVASWFAACAYAESAAAAAIADVDEAEREELWLVAAGNLSEAELLARLQAATRKAAADVRAAAQHAVARQRIREPMLVDTATAAALLAIHHHALAGLAGAPAAHPFMRRHALFSRGRWPLGYHAGRYAIF